MRRHSLFYTLFIALAVGTFAVNAANLNVEWARYYTSETSRYAFGIDRAGDGGFVMAGSQLTDSAGMNVFAATFDSAGVDRRFNVYHGYADDEAFCVKQTSDKGFILCGYTRSSGNGEADILLMKITAALEMEWQQTFGGEFDDMGYSVEQTPDGGYVIVGFVSIGSNDNRNDVVIKTDAGGSLVWHRQPIGSDGVEEAYAVEPTSDGGYVVAGYASSSNGSVDVSVVKLTSTGTTDWFKFIGTADNDEYGFDIIEDHGGSLVIAGYQDPGPHGAGDGFLMKTDSEGSYYGHVQFQSGDCLDKSYSVVQTSEHHYVVAGLTKSEGAGGTDAFWIRYDENFNQLGGANYLPGTMLEMGTAIATTPDSGFLIATTSMPNTQSHQVMVRKYGYDEKSYEFPNILYPYSQAFTCLPNLESVGFEQPNNEYWEYDSEEEAMVTKSPGGWARRAMIYTPQFEAHRDSGYVVAEWKVKLSSTPWLFWRENNRMTVSLCNELGEKLYTLVWKPNLIEHCYTTADMILYRGNDLYDIDILDKAWSHTTTPVGSAAQWLKFQMILNRDGTVQVRYDAADGRGLVEYMDLTDNSHTAFTSMLFQYKTGKKRIGNYAALVDDIAVRVVVEDD